MPSTINGVGTWYWGRANRFEREGHCAACGAVGTLRSYDTTLCFVVLFLPLCPLRRVRVLDECPRCRRHRVVKLKDWRRLCTEELQAALRAWEAAPRSEETITAALGAAVATQNGEAVRQVARGLHLLPEISGPSWAMLAAAEEYFVHLPEAEVAYQKALAGRAGHDARDGYAMLLLRTGRTDHAAPLVSEALHAPSAMSPLLALAAVEAYQAEGRHDDAAQLLEQAEAALPSLRDDKAWRALRKLSTKHRGTDKPLKRVITRPLGQPARRGPTRVRRVPLTTVLILLLAAGGFSAWSMIKAASRQVTVVNGLNIAYQVAINSQTIHLEPTAHRTIQLGEGEVTVRPLAKGYDLPTTHLKLETPFWTRVFRNDTFVINPDQLALLVYREVHYTSGSGGSTPPAPTLHVGEALYHFSSVDFLFQDAPDQLALDSDSTVVKKRELQHFAGASPFTEVVVMQMLAAPIPLLDFIFRHPLREPFEEDYLIAATMLGELEDLRARLQAGLSGRPCRTEVHRLHQRFRDVEGGRDELIAEYRERLAAAPDDPDYLYLLARVTRDSAESSTLYERALERRPDHARALMGMSYWQWNHVGAAAALPYAQRAVEAAPAAMGVVLGYLDQVLADGRKEEWLEARHRYAAGIAPALEAVGRDLATAECEVAVLVSLGRSADARAFRERFVAENSEDYAPGDPAKAERYRRHLEATLTAAEYYAAGDLAAAGRALEGDEDISSQVRRAILAGNLAEADDLLLRHAPADIELHLALLLAGELTGADSLESARVRLGTALRRSGSDERALAEWLVKESSPTEEALREAWLDGPVKTSAYALLARLHPPLRQVCVELAERFNFTPCFPQHLVKAVVEKVDGRPGLTAEQGEPQPNPPDALEWWDP